MKRKFGWVKDKPDKRDAMYADSVKVPKKLPKSVDLRSEMPPVYEQGNINCCHDAETEVLTDSGFKLFSELECKELLAAVDPVTSELTFQKPLRLITMPYRGLMICADNHSLNFKVTPDHMMLVRNWDQSARKLSEMYTMVEAGKLGWYCGLMNRITWEGDQDAPETFTLRGVKDQQKPQREPLVIPMDKWLRFLGIYLAEGTVLEGAYKIQLAASKPREKEFIRTVLSDIGQHYLELEDRFTFENRRLYESLESLGLRGVHAPQKFVPEFVFHQNAENIREFLLGHFMGDGYEQDGHRAHFTSSTRLANDLERLIFLSGDETSWTSSPPQVSMNKRGKMIIGQYDMNRVSVKALKNLSIERKETIFTDEYDGLVYCAEVPIHHTLVTRRRGKILVSGNCTGNAIAAAMEFDELHQGIKQRFIPSRMFIYYNERAMEGTVDKDAGGQIRDGIKSIITQGAPHEGLWAYEEKLLKVKPKNQAFTQGRRYKTVKYLRMTHNLDELRSCLASGFPFIFGIKVYASFVSQQTANTGIVNMPKKGEKVAGLHAVLAVGYDDKTKRFIVRNSYGTDWGKCLAVGTRISLLDGREAAIEDLDEQVWVYSYDLATKKIVPALATPKFAGYKDNMVKVLLDNGESITCTDDHPFLLRDGSYQPAGSLQAGASLMPLYRKGDTHGGRYERFLSPTTSRWLTTHWMVVHELGMKDMHGHTGDCDHLSCEIVVHHKDFNGHNNKPSNLEVIYACSHKAIHRDPILIRRRSEGLKIAWRENHAEWSKISARTIQAYNVSLAQGRISLTTKQIEARRETMRKVGRLPRTVRQRAVSRTNIKRALEVVRLRPRDEDWRSKISKTLEREYSSGKLSLTSNQRAARRQNMLQLLKGRKRDERSFEPKRAMHNRWHIGRNITNRNCVFCFPNHKVVSVEKMSLVLPTYDLIVPNTNNFALSSGVFVHNSGYFTIPYEYLLDTELAHDFWTLRLIR